MSRKMRLLAFVLILTFGAAGAVSAFPLTPRASVTEERIGLFDRVLDWLASRIPSGLTSVWEKAGSQMDPDGDPH